MGILLYPSGVTEEYKPESFTFTDEEIIKIFSEFQDIRTARLYEVPNTWCIWGESEDDTDETNFNKLASDIIEDGVFSHMLFVHDTEINPAWMLTDPIILKGYNEFKGELLSLFDGVAEEILKENERIREEQGSQQLLFLNTIGPTEDKRILTELDINNQNQEFFRDENFNHFANKIFDYLDKNYKDLNLFFIYQDKKSVIYVKEDGVKTLITKMVDFFKHHEQYEKCQKLKVIHEKWVSFKSKNKRKKKSN